MPIAPTAPRCVANARRIAGKQCRACKGVSSCDRRQAATLCRLGVVLAGLGKLFEHHVPFQSGEVINEENSLQMVHLMLQTSRENAVDLLFLDYAFTFHPSFTSDCCPCSSDHSSLLLSL